MSPGVTVPIRDRECAMSQELWTDRPVVEMPELDEHEKTLVQTGQPLLAIKSYRERFWNKEIGVGPGLREAKYKIDEYQESILPPLIVDKLRRLQDRVHELEGRDDTIPNLRADIRTLQSEVEEKSKHINDLQGTIDHLFELVARLRSRKV
jgi:predicted RNase H-like nuclease (RuvC/YqgF family)